VINLRGVVVEMVVDGEVMVLGVLSATAPARLYRP
jgi:hypothetical protein